VICLWNLIGQNCEIIADMCVSGLAEIMLWGGLAAKGPGRRRRPFGQRLSPAARVQGPGHDRCHHPRPPDEDIETIRIRRRL
jgi:hypothetical protein